jgi:hypothetical protein
MLAIDAILLKINEEASEVAIETSRLAQYCDKAIRFGMDSYHPRDEAQSSNHDLMWSRFKALENEYHDLHVSMWLLQLYRVQHGGGWGEEAMEDMAKEWFPNAHALSEAVRKLRKFDRLLPMLALKGSISKEEIEKLQHTLMIGINFLDAIACERVNAAVTELQGTAV